MMDCMRLHELLDAYLAGQLDDGPAAEVQVHLSGCAECADVVATLTSGVSLATDDAELSAVEDWHHYVKQYQIGLLCLRHFYAVLGI